MNDILKKISGAKRIAIAGHVRPDGDCIGSCMAMYNYILNNYHIGIVNVFLEFVPEKFSYIDHVEDVITDYSCEADYDLFISLDCGDTERLGQAYKYFEAAKDTINIDHHISNTKFAAINHVEPESSSTCETLYGLLDEKKLDLSVATALYTGIVHDTGVFKHSNTGKRTMEIAGSLLEYGVNNSAIIDESFYQKTYLQNQLLGRCLIESMLVLDGKCIVSVIRKEMLDFYGATSKDTDGIIDQLRVTSGVEVAMLVIENDYQVYKVSMRSNDLVDVSKIAVYFGGGGHIKAAGCTICGTAHDVMNNILKLVDAQLREHHGC
ncbi:3'-to-5' oligoribonuclease A, Bacillus type [Lachnospiraceae bacterium KM106-2]|nr:3'-to-5' oligoribonuclease A, Bacillus type [Lachnospiraceae bacterium KM106-2]